VRGRQAHLAQLDAALQGVEASRREEILTDVRGHIEEGRTGLDPDDAANVRTLLDRSATPRNRLDRQDRTIMSLLAALVPHPRATRERVPPGALGITSLSQSQIGEVVRDLDAHVEAFRTRPLDAGSHTFVAADALVPQAAVLYHPADAGARHYHPGQEPRQTRRNSSFPV
jgi:transposase-like protein